MSYNYGADQQADKVAKLVEKKAQLEAALPVVDDARAAAIETRLDRIDAQLQKEIAHAKAIGNVAAIKAAMGIDGIGGLEFQTQAPPGVGRMVRLPFYPVTNGIAGYSAGNASLTNPVLTATVPNAYAAQLASITMSTPQISWATLRIVGFETDIHMTVNDAGSAAATSVATEGLNSIYAPKLVVQDLQIGGGANLFTHEDFADAQIYDSAQPEFCGLRDYPILKSPNVAQVTIAALGSGGPAAVGAGIVGFQSITFSVALLCEVLQDDNYGSHIPGPYARKGAMVRRGGSFV